LDVFVVVAGKKGAPHHSTLTPANFTIFAHFSVSSMISTPTLPGRREALPELLANKNIRARLKVTNEPARGNIVSGYSGSICVAIAGKFSAGAETQRRSA